MTPIALRRYALSMAVACALIAGCGGSSLPIDTPDALPQANSGSDSYRVLHNFTFRHDGRTPKGGLTYIDGALYGTTYSGGRYELGTVFRISTSGKENVVHTFAGAFTNDGANPSAGLLAVNHVLYGTTEYGGEANSTNGGSVFKVTTSGSEQVLYRFRGYYITRGRSDGANPVASLIKVKGTLYGTTYRGGSGNFGTVFSISPSGADYTILHNFAFDGDGFNPDASLLYANGTFYGTTYLGPAESVYSGYGTVFTMSPSGAEALLFTFYPEPYGPNGAYPQAALINVRGTFYGTTSSGGAYYQGGTAFSITRQGKLTVLHNFGNGADGKGSAAPLLSVNGTLYGTTSAGGMYGGGTVFSLSRTGTETVLHSFGNGSDGATPLGDLIDVKGTLYGTTSAGGKQGYGTIFALRIK